jgi:hypothetical protein
MTVELQKIREKLERLKNPTFKTSKFDKKTWSPEKDKAKTIRFLKEPQRSSDDPFHELHFHYNMGKSGSILCPRMNANQPCPICEFAFNLRKSGDASDIAIFKQLMPKQRFYGLVVDREDPKLTPKWWGFGKEIYMQLLEALLNPEYATFMDPYEGLDADVSVVQKTGGKTEYSAPKLVFKRKESKLASTSEREQEIYNAITPLTEVFKPLTESEITAKLTAWLEFKATDGGEVTKGAEASVSTQTGEPNGNYSTLDDAFEAAIKDEQ